MRTMTTEKRTIPRSARPVPGAVAVGATCVLLALAAPGDAAAQMQHGLLVDADWVSAHLADDHAVVLHADMRRAGYEEAHLPGARFLDMSRLVWGGEEGQGSEIRSPEEVQAALREAGVRDDHHHVVVYSANPLAAARAFMTLEVMGLQGRVQMLDGGLGGWREEGRDLSVEEPAFEIGDVTLRPRDDVVVDADWVHARLDDPSIALVDARPDDEYTGADGGMGGRTNPGHIPGAHQMYWERLVESRAVPRLHELERLRGLFREAGAEQGETVVAYCMVGMRASFTYFAARLLGYDTKFYDGSWMDWGRRADLPYVTGSSPR
jgi:thiosulfate/3-mercaptopyruvate sulfurtransferase